MNLDELMKLATMKENRPNEYKKVIDGIMSVSKDIIKAGMDALKEVQDE